MLSCLTNIINVTDMSRWSSFDMMHFHIISSCVSNFNVLCIYKAQDFAIQHDLHEVAMKFEG